jgi:hypothetical protein
MDTESEAGTAEGKGERERQTRVLTPNKKKKTKEQKTIRTRIHMTDTIANLKTKAQGWKRK